MLWLGGLALALGASVWLRDRLHRLDAAPPGPYAVATATLHVAVSSGARVVRVVHPRVRTSSPRFPLVLFAPGWGGESGQSQSLLEALASHGYVLVAFDDVALDPPEPGASAAREAARTAVADWTSEAALLRTRAVGDVRVQLEVDKARQVLDALTALHARGVAALAQLDLSRVGILGFSFGGAVAAEATLADPRIRAAVNLDGWLFGEAVTRAVTKPYLLVTSEEAFPEEAALHAADDETRLTAAWCLRDRALHARMLGQPSFAWWLLEGAEHGDFTDALLSPRLAQRLSRGASARMAQRRALEALLVAFFGHALSDQPEPDAPRPGLRRIDRAASETDGDLALAR